MALLIVGLGCTVLFFALLFVRMRTEIRRRRIRALLAARAGPECSNISPSIPMAGSSGRAFAVFALGVGGVLAETLIAARGAKRMLERPGRGASEP